MQSPLQLRVFPSAYKSRGRLTDSGLLLLDSLVFTHQSEEDEIFAGDPKPDPGSNHSLYFVPVLSNQTKGNQNLYHRIAVASELTPSRFNFVSYFRSYSCTLAHHQSSIHDSPTTKEALSLVLVSLWIDPLLATTLV